MICPLDQQPCTWDHSLACSAACLRQAVSEGEARKAKEQSDKEKG